MSKQIPIVFDAEAEWNEYIKTIDKMGLTEPAKELMKAMFMGGIITLYKWTTNKYRHSNPKMKARNWATVKESLSRYNVEIFQKVQEQINELEQ